VGVKLLGFVAFAALACGSREPARPAPQIIRCAVIGGMTETGLWPALAERYALITGNKLELVSTGPKPVIVDAFRKGGIDLITVHASDAMVNLVADGLAVDPQPWVKNDLVIVGPADDPAHIRGEKDAIVAFGKIVAAHAPLLVHASLGADGVLHDVFEAGHMKLGPETVFFNDDNQHAVLEKATEVHAYTLIGRIPFISGKLQHGGMELMVRGDPRLRRPYLVATAAGPATDLRLAAARDFAAFLRLPATQAWIATFGVGKYDDQPLFYPITLP
jgi:tungstate transport system substrate-binding protein